MEVGSERRYWSRWAKATVEGKGRMRGRYVAGVSAIGIAAAAYILFARPRHLRWGASARECDASLPGDDLIVSPDLTATRAITVRASAGSSTSTAIRLRFCAGCALEA